MSRATYPLSIGTILASRVSRLNEYIVIEDDNDIPTVIGVGDGGSPPPPQKKKMPM